VLSYRDTVRSLLSLMYTTFSKAIAPVRGGSGGDPNDLPNGQRVASIALGMLTRARARMCDACSRPVRCWNRRIWLVKNERCVHFACWKSRLFFKEYLQFMAIEIRAFAPPGGYSSNGRSVNMALRELRASASALNERAGRLETQLQQAEAIRSGECVAGGIQRAGDPTGSTRASRERTKALKHEGANDGESAKRINCALMPAGAASVNGPSRRESHRKRDIIELTDDMVTTETLFVHP